jgi:transcriptional regulator with XRE-family HTH domain
MSKSLGRNIRQAREKEGLTQAALAMKVGVTSGAVSQWEAGTATPRKESFKELETVLGFLGDSDISSFGTWLSDARRTAEMSVPDLAAKAHVTAAAIYNIESGKAKNPQAATRKKLSDALGQVIPQKIVKETEEDQAIEGLGSLTDFDPHAETDWPTCAGVYVFYDISQRPIYVGKSAKISGRLRNHFQSFWFKAPIVAYASYIEVKDEKLRHQLEQTMIKFLKSNAVINKQSVQDFEE